MDELVGRNFLIHLVEKEKVAFSTQKQALNALVFFFKDVCGFAEVDLHVKLRKTGKRAHVVLSKAELMGLIERLEEVYKTPALLQYGAGLRLTELVQLRIKDVDIDRGVVTVHAGKGDKDYPRLRRRSAQCKGAPPRPRRMGGTKVPMAVRDDYSELPQRSSDGGDRQSTWIMGRGSKERDAGSCVARGVGPEDAEGGDEVGVDVDFPVGSSFERSR